MPPMEQTPERDERVERTVRHLQVAHPDVERLDPMWLDHPIMAHEAIHHGDKSQSTLEHAPVQAALVPGDEPGTVREAPQVELVRPARGETRYRVGRSLGRTVYDGDTLIGMMDTPDLAAMVVRALNRSGL